MPLLDFVPATTTAEDKIAEQMDVIRPLLKTAVDNVLHYGENDILVNLQFCSTRDSDPKAADAVLYIETLIRPETQANLDALRDSIQLALTRAGILPELKIEIWARVIDSSWCAISGGEVVESGDRIKTKREE